MKIKQISITLLLLLATSSLLAMDHSDEERLLLSDDEETFFDTTNFSPDDFLVFSSDDENTEVSEMIRKRSLEGAIESENKRIKLIRKQQAEINKQFKVAIQNKNLKAIDELLKLGARPIFMIQIVDTSFTLETIKILLDLCAQFYATDLYYDEVLAAIITQQFLDTDEQIASINYIISQKPSALTPHDDDTWTLLHQGTCANTEIIKTIIKAGVDIETKCPLGFTPLIKRLLDGDTDTAEILLNLGADVATKDTGSKTALHYLDFIEAKLYTKLQHDYSLSLNAIKKVTDTLVKHGADINAQDNTGNTPLHVAATSSHNADYLIEILVKLGADPNITNNDGLTAEQVAHNSNNKYVENYLQNFNCFMETQDTFIPHEYICNDEAVKECQSNHEEIELKIIPYNSSVEAKKWRLLVHPQSYWLKVITERGSVFYLDCLRVYDCLSNSTIFTPNETQKTVLEECLENFPGDDKQLVVRRGMPLSKKETTYKALLLKNIGNKIFTDTIIKCHK